MRQLVQAYRGVVRGTSSGWMVSVFIHLGIGIIAASVYFVLPEEEPYVQYYPVEMVEPVKIDLPPPPVQIRQAPQPTRQAETIVVEQQSIDQPTFVVPDLEVGPGMPGVDFGGVLVDFHIPHQTTPIGEKINSGFGFEGTFYDFKRNRKGGPAIMDPHQFVAEIAAFVGSGWKTSKLARYYRAPNKLYAECFMVPPVRSSVAPAAFEEEDTLGYCWLAHYKGQLSYHEDITFRFWGHGDDILAVRVDGEEVLVACWPSTTWGVQDIITSAAGGWQSSSPKSRTYSMGNNTAVVGDWITLKANQPLDMEVIIGEVPGGTFCSMLTVEVQGQEYDLNRQQGPILPMFKTTELSRDLKDWIHEWLTKDHARVSGGPIFRDIPPKEHKAKKLQPLEIAEPAPQNESAMRFWAIGGQEVEAEFMTVIGDQVMLKSARGKQIKLPLANLMSEDRTYVELVQPPEFNLSFTKKSAQRIIETTPFLNEIPPRILDYTFGAKIRQTSARAYGHAIKAELFVIGRQRIDDRKYILLDQLNSTFVPVKENERSHAFHGRPVEIMSYDTDQPLGRKYSDYLLVLTDERGEIIDYSSSANWLFPNLGKLRKLKIGNFMDQSCTRVYPTGPGPKSLYDE